MLPEALRSTAQWLVSGKDKAPRSPRTGALVDVRDRAQYATYEEALAYAQKRSFDVGFVLTTEDPFVVIDLDNKPDDPATPEELDRQRRIFETFDTYAELSVSGTGVHIWCMGSAPRGVRRNKVELYPHHRYMVCTGRVLKDRPVQDCNDLVSILFKEMARNGSGEVVHLVERDELLSDKEVVEMAMGAANSDKFNALCNGHWQGDYPSQSEADYALMNMFCFYTKSNEQCRRLFRMSKLGHRDKAQRQAYLDGMIVKIRGEEPPPVDFSKLLVAGEQAPGNPTVGRDDRSDPELRVGSPPSTVFGVTLPAVESTPGVETGKSFLKPTLQVPGGGKKSQPTATQQGEISYPPGFAGEIARYIVDSSTRPVPEVGIAAAIALCAGVLGRQYNVSGTGLNLYLVLLAKTGVGKESAAGGIERLLHAARSTIPAVDTFVGPANFASGQAIIRTLDEKRCFFSVLGEFGLTLQTLADPNASGHLVVMRRALLDLYSKSGKTALLHSSAYSDQAKNTKIVPAPALTIFGESTPESFYAGLSLYHIADGLIPRFLIVEYHGDRPKRNKRAFAEPDENLVKRFADLAEVVLRMTANSSFCDVQLDPAAEVVLDAFDKECDGHIAGAEDEAVRQLWNRAHLKALKLSALLAVADRPHVAVVTDVEAQWATDFVRYGTEDVLARFDRGDVGQGASKQIVDLQRIISNFAERTPAALATYGVTADMWAKRVIPYVYLQRRSANLTSFRGDRRGATSALRDTIQSLLDMNILRELPKVQCTGEFGYHGRMFYLGI